MKHVYSGGENMTPNERHEFSNNLIRSIANTNDTESAGMRTVSLKGTKMQPEK